MFARSDMPSPKTILMAAEYGDIFTTQKFVEILLNKKLNQQFITMQEKSLAVSAYQLAKEADKPEIMLELQKLDVVVEALRLRKSSYSKL